MSIYDSLYAKYMQEANDYAKSFDIEPSTAHNGAWDAFRHAYASGAMHYALPQPSFVGTNGLFNSIIAH